MRVSDDAELKRLLSNRGALPCWASSRVTRRPAGLLRPRYRPRPATRSCPCRLPDVTTIWDSRVPPAVDVPGPIDVIQVFRRRRTPAHVPDLLASHSRAPFGSSRESGRRGGGQAVPGGDPGGR